MTTWSRLLAGLALVLPGPATASEPREDPTTGWRSETIFEEAARPTGAKLPEVWRSIKGGVAGPPVDTAPNETREAACPHPSLKGAGQLHRAVAGVDFDIPPPKTSYARQS